VVFQEIGNYVASENEAYSSLILRPPIHSFLRVCPQQITKQPLIWYFDRPNYFQNLLKVFHLRAEATMHAHDLLVDDGADWHDVKDIRKSLPEFDIIFSFAFVNYICTLIVESIDSVDT
jgi:hypothetical protein